MNIKQWPAAERPREKILERGARGLSDAELLAVFFGSGMRGLDAVAWARQHLGQTGGMRAFLNLDTHVLIGLPGMGPARTAKILALREMLSRLLKAKLPVRFAAKDPESLADYLRLAIGNEKREKFRVIFLNKKLEILEEKDLFAGTVDETPVYPREIVEQAIYCRATAVILAHNHPSGRLQPSPEDIQITRKIMEVCRLIGVRVLDHLIVGAEGYFSFSGEGLLLDLKN